MINTPQWVSILQISLIEVSIVRAHPPFTVGLFHHNHICKLGDILFLSDETDFHKLVYFISYGVELPFAHLFFLLGNKSCLFIRCLIISGLTSDMSEAVQANR